MCTIGYAVGIDLYGNPVSPSMFSVSFSRRGNPPLQVSAQWSTEIIAAYFYGLHVTGYYTDPIIIVPDYPVFGIVFKVWVTAVQ
jgi:hypothetical protein